MLNTYSLSEADYNQLLNAITETNKMDAIEKLQKEIELTKELLALKEKLLEIEKQFGVQRIEYIPYTPYPYYPMPTFPFFYYPTTTGTTVGGGTNITELKDSDLVTYTN